MIAFIGRGGSGKTALASISAMLASLKRDVVLIDSDPTTAKLTSIFFGRFPIEASLLDYLIGEGIDPSSLFKPPIPVKDFKPEFGKPPLRGKVEEFRLQIIPNKVDLNGLIKLSKQDPHLILAKFMDLYKYAVSEFSDPLIIMDTPAGTQAPAGSYALTLASMIKQMVVVVTPDRNTVDTTARVVRDFSEYMEMVAVVLNWFDKTRPFFYHENSNKPLYWVDYVTEKFGVPPIVIEYDTEFNTYMSSDSIPLDKITELTPVKSLLGFVKKLTGMKMKEPSGILIDLTEKKAKSLFTIEEEKQEEEEYSKKLEMILRELEGEESKEIEKETEEVKPVPEAKKPARKVRATEARTTEEEMVLVMREGDVRISKSELLRELRSLKAPADLIEKMRDSQNVYLDSLPEDQKAIIKKAIVRLGVPIKPTAKTPEVGEDLKQKKVELPKLPKMKLPSLSLGFRKPRTIKIIYQDGSIYEVDRNRFSRVLNMFGFDALKKLVEEREEIGLGEIPPETLSDPKFKRILTHFGLPEPKVKEEKKKKRKILED